MRKSNGIENNPSIRSNSVSVPCRSSSTPGPPSVHSAVSLTAVRMSRVIPEIIPSQVDIDSPLSSKVAMFNKREKSHIESQETNPFSESHGGMQRLKISKEEYGRPKAGSLTEYRGKKANIQVYQEMVELCTVIHDEGHAISKQTPELRGILFGELFNIYTHINDKLVGLLLRARKHGLIEWEGEVLFQRRDDNVPILLLKPIKEIREKMSGMQTEIRRSLSPNPQPTNCLK